MGEAANVADVAVAAVTAVTVAAACVVAACVAAAAVVAGSRGIVASQNEGVCGAR